MSAEPEGSATAPLFSIVICTYNRAAVLPAAMRSVFDQTFTDLELIVVDDGSTDGTRLVVEGAGDHRVRYVHQANAGLSAARNTGARAAAGRFLVFLDDDDHFSPELLERVAAAIDGAPLVVVSWGSELVDEDGTVLEYEMPRDLGEAFAGQRALFKAGTFAVPRRLYLEVGGFDEELRTSHQTEFSLRLLPVCRAGGIDVVALDRPLIRIVERRAQRRERNDPARLLEATLRILDRHEQQLARSPAVLADYLATAGVAAARVGRCGEARDLFWRAARIAPRAKGRAENLARAAVAAAPPLARRVWPADLTPSLPAQVGSVPARVRSAATAAAGSLRRAASRAKRAALSRRVVTVASGPAAGLRIGLHLASADYRRGDNELPVQLAFVDHVRPGQTVYDIGSNVGFFALLAARLVGHSGSVHAFEAVPACAAALNRNVARNGFDQVKVHAVAVSDHGGRIEVLQGRHPGGATTSRPDRPERYVGSIFVPAVTIDDMTAAGRLPLPDFVKIDVEGAEVQVLEGMEATLTAARPVVLCELDDPSDVGIASKVDRVGAILAGHGYDLEQLEPSYLATRSRVVHLLAIAGPAGHAG